MNFYRMTHVRSAVLFRNFVCTSMCLSVHVQSAVCPSMCLSTVCPLSVRPCVRTCVCPLSLRPCVCPLSVRLCVSPSVCLSTVCPSMSAVLPSAMRQNRYTYLRTFSSIIFIGIVFFFLSFIKIL